MVGRRSAGEHHRQLGGVGVGHALRAISSTMPAAGCRRRPRSGRRCCTTRHAAPAGGATAARAVSRSGMRRRRDGVEMVGERGLAGVHGGQMQEPDIDAAGLARVETLVEHLPGTAKGRAREELLAEHRMTEGLRLPDQGVDEVAVVDDAQERTAALEVSARTRSARRGAEMADQAIVVDVHLEAAADQPRGHGVEDVADRDRAEARHGDGRDAVIAGAVGGSGASAASSTASASCRRRSCAGRSPAGKPGRRPDRRSPASRAVRAPRSRPIFRWPCAASTEPFSWLTPALLRVGSMP